MTTLIYIADDDANIRSLISKVLEKEIKDSRVKAFETGDQLFLAFLKEKPQLVILDVMMPGTNGFKIAEMIRQESGLPILLLTAKDSDDDFIEGFGSGVDDYLTKPISPIRISLQVKSLLNRRGIRQSSSGQAAFAFNGLTLSEADRMVSYKQKQQQLTANEFEVLKALIKADGLPVSRDDLLNDIWGIDQEDVETRVTDDTIKRLRQKLRKVDSHVVIETIWGYGFKLSEKI